jgi:hypothetical protein
MQVKCVLAYQECEPSQLDNLAVIEETIRQQTLEYIPPQNRTNRAVLSPNTDTKKHPLTQ